MLRDLALPGGGFASSQDADTDGVEGLTYTWTRGRGRAGRAAAAVRARPLDHPRRARRPSCARGCSRMRAQRPQPARDDKAIAAWNGLALAALAEAGRRFASNTVLLAAEELAKFLLGALSTPDGRLYRTWREGRASDPRLPRGLRRRRARPLRAARRDRRAALARGVAPPRAARGRAVRRRRARRLLHDARATPSSSSRARRTSTTTRCRRATRCSRTSCCGSRGSTATTSSSGEAVGVLRLRAQRTDAGAVGVRLGAVRARPPPLAAARARDHRRARATRSRARRSRRSTRTRSSRSARPRTCRCSRARRCVDGKPTVYVCERFACRAPVTELMS